jgi:hypothetical protein
MIGIRHGCLDELARDRRLGRSENDARLLFAFRLRLPQSAVLRPISPRKSSSAALRSDRSAASIDDPM